MGTIGSYVALGDSFTEGLHDVLGPDGRHRGWADRVAAGLAAANGGTLGYANLAVRGRLLGQVVAEQLPVALELAPDLVSFHAGANDVLRPRVDVDAVLAGYDDAVGRLRASGAEVVLFTVLERAGGTGRLADALARRFAYFNAGIRRTAERRGARLADVGGVRPLQDRRMWHEDRLHLAPQGHARVAAAVLETLGIADQRLLGGPPGWWRDPLLPERRSMAAKLVSDGRWVGRYLLPWVWRRVRGTSSGDRVIAKRPELVQIADAG